jgi:hypothetical protein
MKKAKKKITKKRTAKPKAQIPASWEYFVDELLISTKTEDVQNRFDELGKAGWQLLFIGPYGDPQNHVRIYWMRPGAAMEKTP